MTTDSLTPAAPPADAMEEETFVLNGLVTTDLRQQIPVPLISLVNGEKICRHPEDNEQTVNWRVKDRTDVTCLVVAYVDNDTGESGEYTFESTSSKVWVEVGQVYR